MNKIAYTAFNLIIAVGVLALAFSCSSEGQPQMTKEDYQSKINEWHGERVKSLKEEDSWLSLAGLYELNEGAQSLGSDSSQNLVFPPKAPDQIGTITLRDSIFTFKAHPGANVTHKGSTISEMKLQSNGQGEPDVLRHGSLLWYVIERRGNYYIRLKDTDHPNFSSFEGIERFPISQKWRVKASFNRFDEPQLISIPDIMGDVYQDSLYGTLDFTIGGKNYSLAPLGHPDKDEEFFVIFGDNTNGGATYGGGRYIYIGTPNENGITYIDFNKAYNPPCVFTNFATCPLPPAQNRLPIDVTAGEKMYDL